MARSPVAPSAGLGQVARLTHDVDRAALAGGLAGHAALLAALAVGGTGMLGGHRSLLERVGAGVVLAMAGSLLARTARPLPDRAAWALFGVALASRAAGELFPTLLTTSVLVYYAAAIAGAALLIRARRSSWDSLLDPLAAGLAVSAGALALIEGPLVTKLDTSSWLAAVLGSGDAVLAGLALALLAAHGWRVTRQTVLLTAGIAAPIAADVIFLATDEPLRDFTSVAALLVWPACSTLIAIAAWQPARRVPALREAGLWRWSIGTPAAAVLAVGVMLSDAVVEIGRIPHTLAGAAVLAVAARTALTMRRQRLSADRLRSAEQRYRTLVEQMPAVTYVADLGESGAWHYVSPQVETLLGYGPSEFVERSSLWIELVHPDDRARVVTAETALGRRGTTLECEYRMIARDGRVLHVRDEAVRVGDDGRVLGFLVDVTARRDAQLDAQRRGTQQSLVAGLNQRALAGASLQELFDEAVDAVVSALGTELGEVLEVEPGGGRLVLRSGSGWRPAGIGSATGIEPTSLARAALASAAPIVVDDVRTETRFPATAALHRHRVVSSASVAIRYGEHAFGVLGVHSIRHRPFTREDTEFLQTIAHALAAAIQRERTDAARQHAELRFRRVLEGAPDGIVAIGRDGAIALANRRALELFGHDELLGVRWGELGATSEWQQVIEDTALGPTESAVALLGRRADGTEFAADVSVSWLEDGALRLASIRDVTDRVSEQNEREALRARLEHAQRLETIGQLTSGIAHDFNNVLLVIKGYAAFLAGEVAGDRARDHVAQITQATDTASALTRQLLSFSTHRTVEPALVSVNDVIQRIRKLLDQSLGARCSLELGLDRALPPVRADATQLEQVLLNLTVNARDAMPEGGTVRIETALVAEGSAEHVQISVRDAGVGMSPEVKERLFDAFFTTKPAGKGTGLGLATVHGIVTEAGGRIEVESEPGSGTEIAVVLPAAGAPARAPRRPAQHVS